jgi:hypothetical protein
VIEMDMRENDRVDLSRIEWEWLVIQRFQRPGALEQAAIDQDRLPASAQFEA